MDDVATVLKDLVATCRASEEGFGKAAKGTQQEILRNRLMGIAKDRADFAGELSEHLRKLGMESVSGHQSGIQHRGWRELEINRPRDDGSLIAFCEAGEQTTLHRYEHSRPRHVR